MSQHDRVPLVSAEIVFGRFIRRPNRFLAEVEIVEGSTEEPPEQCPEGSAFLPGNATIQPRGRVEIAFLPNPGRMTELAFPGVGLYMTRSEPSPTRRTTLTVHGLEKDGHLYLVNSALANKAAAELIRRGGIHGLEGYSVVAGEFRAGNSRFDFLLSRTMNGDQSPDTPSRRFALLEVKCCNLIAGGSAAGLTASFPDAPTERASRHLKTLSELAGTESTALKGIPQDSPGPLEAFSLILVTGPKPDRFMPNVNTDPRFASAYLETRGTVTHLVAHACLGRDLAIPARADPIPVDWEDLRSRAIDRGSYIIVTEVTRAASIEVGSLGTVDFAPGFYAYVGSAMNGLRARIARHMRKGKKLHWHIDRLLAEFPARLALPIPGPQRTECQVARRVREIAETVSGTRPLSAANWTEPEGTNEIGGEIPDHPEGEAGLGEAMFWVKGFGCSDCDCGSHLFRFAGDPLKDRAVVEALFEMMFRRRGKP